MECQYRSMAATSIRHALTESAPVTMRHHAPASGAAEAKRRGFTTVSPTILPHWAQAAGIIVDDAQAGARGHGA